MRITVWACVLALVAATSGCKKDGKKAGGKDGTSGLPAEVLQRAAAVDPKKLTPPALLAHVPADTPYVMASFEAIPLEYWAKIRTALAPAMGQAVAEMRAEADSKGLAVLDAVLSELDGKWNKQGFESLGFSATPRFVVYGLGLMPVVLRLELKDHTAVMATVDRIAKKVGATLPPQQTHEGKSYWRFDEDDMSFVVALVDNQFVAAGAPAAAMTSSLGLVLGSQKPQASMADGKALIDVMTKHGFGPYLIALVESRHLGNHILAMAEKTQLAPCVAEVQRLATKVPRMVMGYAEVTLTKTSGGVVVELSPDLAALFETLKTPVIGLAESIAGKPLFAMGGGVDLKGAQQVAQALPKVMRTLGEACQEPGLAEAAGEADEAFSQPIPEPFAQIKGAVLSVQDIGFSKPGPPDKLEGFAILTSPKAKDIAAVAGQFVKLKTDGKLHPIDLSALDIPLSVVGGANDQTITVAVGASGKAQAETARSASPMGKAPFLVVSYDYGRFIELQSKFNELFGEDDSFSASVNARLAKLLGRAWISADVSPKGLVLWTTMEMK